MSKIKIVSLNYSSCASLAVVGFVFIYASLTFYFLGGDVVKSAMQQVGLGVVMVSLALMLVKDHGLHALLPSIGACCMVFVALVGVTKMNVVESTGEFLPHQLLCFILFFAGFFIARDRQGRSLVFNIRWLYVALILMLVPSLFYVKSLGAQADIVIGRSVEDATLHPISVAYTFAIFALFSLVVAIFSWRNRMLLILSVSVVAAAMTCIVMTGSRGALLFVLVAAFWVFCCMPGWRKKTYAAIVGGLFLVLFACVLIYFDKSFTHSRLDFLMRRFDALQYGEDAAGMGRLALIHSYLRDWDSVLPFGLKGYSLAIYPHNSFIELFVRFGVIGVGVALGLLVAFYYSAVIVFRGMRCGKIAWVLFGALFIFTFLQSMTSLSLERNRAMWFSLGFVFSCIASGYLGRVGGARGRRRGSARPRALL